MPHTTDHVSNKRPQPRHCYIKPNYAPRETVTTSELLHKTKLRPNETTPKCTQPQRRQKIGAQQEKEHLSKYKQMKLHSIQKCATPRATSSAFQQCN